MDGTSSPEQTAELTAKGLSRRKLIRNAAVLAGGAAAAVLEQKTGIIGTVLSKCLQTAEDMQMDNAEMQAVIEEQKKWADYKGPLKYYIPEHFNGRGWNSTEQQNLNTMIAESTQIITDIYGENVAWVNDEAVCFVKDFKITPEYIETYPKFIDGNALKESSTGNISGRMNIISIPSTVNLDSTDAFTIVENKSTIAHEMTHAHSTNQNMPTIWKEALAEIPHHIIKKKYFEEVEHRTVDFEKLLQNNYPNFNTWQNLRGESLTGLIETNNMNARKAYDFAGYAFYNWHLQNPHFFKELRKAENNHFVQTSQIPSKDQWLQFGNQIQPEFQHYIETQPVLALAD